MSVEAEVRADFGFCSGPVANARLFRFGSFGPSFSADAASHARQRPCRAEARWRAAPLCGGRPGLAQRAWHGLRPPGSRSPCGLWPCAQAALLRRSEAALALPRVGRPGRAAGVATVKLGEWCCFHCFVQQLSRVPRTRLGIMLLLSIIVGVIASFVAAVVAVYPGVDVQAAFGFFDPPGVGRFAAFWAWRYVAFIIKLPAAWFDTSAISSHRVSLCLSCQPIADFSVRSRGLRDGSAPEACDLAGLGCGRAQTSWGLRAGAALLCRWGRVPKPRLLARRLRGARRRG